MGEGMNTCPGNNFLTCSPVCHSEGPQWWILLPLSFLSPWHYTVMWMQRMRKHLFKALGYFIWWPQSSLSAIQGKLSFRGVPPNSECIRAWSVWHFACKHTCKHTHVRGWHAHLRPTLFKWKLHFKSLNLILLPFLSHQQYLRH